MFMIATIQRTVSGDPNPLGQRSDADEGKVKRSM